MKLKFLAAVVILFSLLLFGCIPENNMEENSETTEYTVNSSAQTEETTAATTDKNGGAFGNIEDEGEFPEISFDEFK